MPSRSWLNRIRDILNAIDEIQGFTEDMTIEDFQADPRTVKAVLYNMAILGEAARNLPSEVEELYPEIPWVDVRGIRNVEIHEYFQVNLEIIWQTIQEDLVPLASSLSKLLE
ncbi:MAG TPA: DUF86 domain-containing protein [Cyanobacteria bacterium UBA8553]|nr:DUF86 domain-containing protein [Cyanobacteria bacterium UBA8553]HAJ64684.1 DUF86 domain-containing protein [Cyanobacteria bacterium UBA8543]